MFKKIFIIFSERKRFLKSLGFVLLGFGECCFFDAPLDFWAEGPGWFWRGVDVFLASRLVPVQV